jgi:hypothetical protein
MLEINHSLYFWDDYAFNSDNVTDTTLEKYSLVYLHHSCNQEDLSEQGQFSLHPKPL